jgi:hypothetical protein
MTQKNNLNKIPFKILNEHNPLKMPKHTCNTCGNQSVILYNGFCEDCLNLPLEDIK